MKESPIQSFVEGFKGSFRLAAALLVAVASTISDFANQNREQQKQP